MHRVYAQMRTRCPNTDYRMIPGPSRMEGGNHEKDVYEPRERQEDPTQIQAWHTRWNTRKRQSSGASVLWTRDAGTQHAIDEFVAWYCSEPRLALNKTVVLRYRFHLEERGLAPGTINVRLAAVAGWLTRQLTLVC